MKITKTEDLTVFKRAHRLTLDIYKITEKFPKYELWGLTSQIRRSAASICANLLEGSHRINSKEYRQFAGIAKGSSGEVKYHLLLAYDLGYLSSEEYAKHNEEIEEISKMLHGLIKSLG
ncbi:MAG: four helix bundle protein [Thermodesulfovibrionales bacterium]|nr:four helix bundle protein [Thermodesulfovibrionales bacterium]